jgi:4-hydroxy-L-threonine phosphate dehydrogenase PdxA
MAVTQLQKPTRPRVAITLGDPAGIGPELIAKLLSKPENLAKADIYVLADRSEFNAAVADAGGVKIPISDVAGPNGVQILDDSSAPAKPFARAEVTKEGGARCMHQLQRGLDLAEAGEIDAIVFGPLNKTSLKKAGMTEEDELRWFAKQLQFKGTTSEINIAGPLWTGRVTSHVGLEKVAAMITKESTLKAIQLLNRLR